MARAFVTGSSTGLGLMAAQLLLELGHRVVVHGRNQARADVALAAAPRADAAVIGDLSKIRDMRAVAEQVNRLGEFDAVIHNAGIGYRELRRIGHRFPTWRSCALPGPAGPGVAQRRMPRASCTTC
jgi:NAD(P)-dependent dehydrogenase (short-subunit alcohol dehydrogenase family)